MLNDWDYNVKCFLKADNLPFDLTIQVTKSKYFLIIFLYGSSLIFHHIYIMSGEFLDTNIFLEVQTVIHYSYDLKSDIIWHTHSRYLVGFHLPH